MSPVLGEVWVGVVGEGGGEGKVRAVAGSMGGVSGLCKGKQLSITRGTILSPSRLFSISPIAYQSLSLITLGIGHYTVNSSTLLFSSRASTNLPGLRKWGMFQVIIQWPHFSSVSHRETIAILRAYPCCGWSHGHKG